MLKFNQFFYLKKQVIYNSMNKYLNLLSTCSAITFLYGVIYNLFSLNNTFNVLDKPKKLYITKNILKSIILAYISICSFYDSLLFSNVLDNDRVYKYASLYVGNDIMALLIVPNLAKSTIIHHSVTTILLFYCYTVNFNNDDDIGKVLLIYTILSSYSFIVNFNLGIRFFNWKKLTDITTILSYYIYCLCCFVNWGSHAIIYSNKLITNTLNIKYIIYLFIIGFVVNDDIVLIRWLYKRKNKITYK